MESASGEPQRKRLCVELDPLPTDRYARVPACCASLAFPPARGGRDGASGGRRRGALAAHRAVVWRAGVCERPLHAACTLWRLRLTRGEMASGL